jgi:hypothetical protein
VPADSVRKYPTLKESSTCLEGGCNVRGLEAVSIRSQFTHNAPRLFEYRWQVLVHENDFVKDYRLGRSTPMKQIRRRERPNILWPTTMKFIHSVL